MLWKQTTVRRGPSNPERVKNHAKDVRFGRVLPAGVGAPFMVADAAWALEDTVGRTAIGSGATDAISLYSEYPVLASAATVLLALGGIAVASSLKPARTASTAAADAFEALKAEERCVLVDIRCKAMLKEEGVVDLKEADKKPVNIVYAERDAEGALLPDPEFAANVQQAEGVSEASIVILIDSDGSLSPKAAADLAKDGFIKEKVFWVRGGMEGPKGWKESELPTKPYRVFELPLPSLELPSVDLAALAAELQVQVPEMDLQGTLEKVNDTVTGITDKYKENPTLANGVLAAAGIVTVGAFALTELDAIVQVVGALGLARFLATRLLFAKDREATLAAIREFLRQNGLSVAAGAAAGDTAAPGVSAGGGGSSEMRKLVDIMMEAPNADSAARQLAEQMGPDVRNVDVGALAAALAASGVEIQPAAPIAAIAAMESAAPDTWAETAVIDLAPAEAVAVSAVATAEAAPPAPVPIEAGNIAQAPIPQVAQAGAAAAESVPEAAPAPATTLEASPAAEVSVAPANVLEAREWIAAWKASSTAAAAEEAAAVPVAEVESSLAPANVLEAREWIAAWKASSTAAAAEEAAAVPVAEVESSLAPANVLEAREWIAAWKASSTAAAAEEAAAVPVAEVESSLAPANVLEAREWIAAWKASSTAAAAEEAAAVPVAEVESSLAPANVLEAREWIAAWRASSTAAAEEEAAAVPVAEVESGLAPANVLEAREWIAAWKYARGVVAQAAEPAVAMVATMGGDGASDADPVVAAGDAEASTVEQEAVVELITANVPA